MAEFDIEGARSEGYTDDQMLEYLGSKHKFDVGAALREGYSKQEVLGKLANTPVLETKGYFPTVWEQVKKTGKGLLGFGLQVDATMREPQTYGGPLGKQLVQSITEPVNKYLFQPKDRDILQALGDTTLALLGADPEEAQRHARAGDIGGAWAAYTTIPLLGLLAGIGGGLKRVPNIPTRKAVDAAASLIDSRSIRQTFRPLEAGGATTVKLPPDVDILTGVTALNQPLKQQAARELGITPQQFPRREGFLAGGDIMGKVKRGGKRALDILDRTVEIAHRPIKATIELYGDRAAPGVQNAVRHDLIEAARQCADIDPPLSKAIHGVAKNVQDHGGTIRGLNELKVHANKEINNLLTASEGKQVAASAQSSYAYKLAADSIRKHLYAEIKRIGGPNLTEYGVREAAAIMERDGVTATYFERVAPAQATRTTMDYLNYVLQGSLYKSHVARRALVLEPLPLGRFNNAFRQGLGAFGKAVRGSKGEVISARILPGRTRGLLPPAKPGQPYTFTISGPDVVEHLSRTDVIPGAASMEYLGGRTVPGPRYSPVKPKPPGAGTSYFRQKQDYGVGIETIPESARGIRSPAKVRQDQLGSTQHVLPERSFTGPETETVSNWQYIAPESTKALPGTTGGGTLITSDPSRVVRTLADIINKLKQRDIPPSVRRALETARDDLMEQLNTYTAYQRFQPPPSAVLEVTPGKQGMKPRGGYIPRIGTQITGQRTLRDIEPE